MPEMSTIPVAEMNVATQFVHRCLKILHRAHWSRKRWAANCSFFSFCLIFCFFAKLDKANNDFLQPCLHWYALIKTCGCLIVLCFPFNVWVVEKIDFFHQTSATIWHKSTSHVLFESQHAFPGYPSPGHTGFRVYRLPLRETLFAAIFYFIPSSSTRSPRDISTQVPGEVFFTYTKSLLFWQLWCICWEGLHHFAKNDMKRPVLKLAMTMFSSCFGWGNNKLGS